MTKVRIYQLAKELGVSNKDLMSKLSEQGVNAHNHMESLEDGTVAKMKAAFNKPAQPPQEKKPEAAPPRPQTDRPQSERPQGDRPQGDRPQSQGTPGDRPQGDRPQGQGYQGNRPQGDRPQGQGYQGNRPQGDRPQGQGYQGNRPQGNRPKHHGGIFKPMSPETASQLQEQAARGEGEQRPQGDRPQGQGYQGNRPQGDRPGYQGNRPQGDRPGYQGNRPQGDRPQGQGYQGNRPQGDRPQGQGYQGNRPQGDRPQGQGYQGNRPQGDRPQGQGYQGNRPQGDRPQGQGYQGNRPQGDRPGYQGNRPQGDRPGYQGNRPQGDRPGYQGNRPQGDRPGYQGNRPQGDRPGYQGNRPQGDRPQGQGYQGNRPQGQRSSGGGYGMPAIPPVPMEKKDLVPTRKTPSRGGQHNDDRYNRSERGGKPDKKKNSRQDLRNVGLDYEDDGKPYPKVRTSTRRRGADGEGPVHTHEKKGGKGSEAMLLPEVMTVTDFAKKLNKLPKELIMKLMGLGIMAGLNQEIDFETMELLAMDFGLAVQLKTEENIEKQMFDFEDDEKDLVRRPPVVTVMGHVDHGKTSLLDAIRNTTITDGEAGGITQHIGASEVTIKDQRIVFLDTPGHEAFTTLRARGAQVTDIAILVVAADDGVMPQTIEAINHAKAAKVPIIVAINKIDKPNANIDRVKKELSGYGVLLESWGGDTVSCEVSAKQGIGIDTLLEMVLLVAEMQNLKANPNRPANGTIIEAKVDKGRGPVATVLVQNGTLKEGDAIIAGATYGRVRAMFNDKGKRITEGGPSSSAEIIGLSEVPQAGDRFFAVQDERKAKQLAERRQQDYREMGLRAGQGHVTLEDLFSQIQQGKIKDLNIIIKADVHGSVEALKQSLLKLSNDEVRVNIIHTSVGTISENDILLASASNAIIIGFNVRPSVTVQALADKEQVDLKTYQIIYNAINDIEAAMKGMLDPIYKEVVLGKVEVRATFKVPKIGVIAGGYVLDGKVTRNANVRLLREGIIIHDGKLASLKRFKDDVKEVAYGYECGLGIENYDDLKEGDIIEAYIMEEVKRS